MFGFGNKVKQDICLLPGTNRVIEDRLEAGNTHVFNDDTAEAWGLDASQQCIDERTNRYIQFVSSLNCDPVPIYRSQDTPPIKSNVSLISSQTEDQEMVYLDKRASKSSMGLWLGICLALLTLTVCIIALVRIWGN